MNPMKSQTGITLIEVLATLTILSILLGSIYSVFFNGLRSASRAEDTVLIQQEANYVLTTLKEQHLNSTIIYPITIKDKLEITIGDNVIQNNRYEYEIYKIVKKNDTLEYISAEDTLLYIDPKSEFHVIIKVIDKNNPNLTYEINTILKKL